MEAPFFRFAFSRFALTFTPPPPPPPETVPPFCAPLSLKVLREKGI